MKFIYTSTAAITIIISLSMAQTSFAKAPTHGANPVKGRTTGYWVSVERVVDGDTFWGNGVKYRLSNLDAPETRSDPRHGYKCRAEKLLGDQATKYARVLIADRKVWIKPTGHWDGYNRPLVKVRVAKGQWFGDLMIKAELAAVWNGRKHEWCALLSKP